MDGVTTFLNSTGRSFVDFAAAMLVQSSVLIVILFTLDLVLRRKVRAVVRYCLWMLVLLKLVLPTSLSLPTGLGYWFGGRLPEIAVEKSLVGEEPGPKPAALVIGATETVTLEQAVTAVPPPRDVPAQPTPPAPAKSERARPVPRVAPAMTWQGLMFLAWLAAVVAMVLLLVQRMFFVRGLVAQSKPAGGNMLDVFGRCQRQMRVRRQVGLKLSPVAASPSVCGLFRSIILIPEGLAEKLDSQHLKSILLHELAHIKRGDLWVSFVQTLLQIAYIYSPLVWVANAVIRKVREQAVDEMVLAAMGDEAEDYPETLLNVSRLTFSRPALSLRLVGVVESKKALTSRIKHILSRPFPKTAKLGLLGLLAVFVAGAILLPMANEEPSSEALFEAASKGHAAKIRMLLDQGVDVNSRIEGESIGTVLHAAVANARVDCVKLLLERGAQVNARNAQGETPLHRAAGGSQYSGHSDRKLSDAYVEIARLLIDAGADVNARAEDGDTPLLTAARRLSFLAKSEDANPDFFRLLIACGADVNARGESGLSALTMAVMMQGYWKGQPQDERAEPRLKSLQQTIELLLASGAQKDIFSAAGLGDTERVATILEQDPSTVSARRAFGMEPLQMAAMGGHQETVKLLVERGGNVFTRDVSDSPFRYAALVGDLEMFKLLEQLREKYSDRMRAGDREIYYYREAMGSAIQQGHAEIVAHLVDQERDIKGELMEYGVLEAAGEGQVEVVKVLLERGAGVHGGAALLKAGESVYDRREPDTTMQSYLEIAKLLIEAGADVNWKGREGATSLLRAAASLVSYKHKSVNTDFFKLLIEKGADVNGACKDHKRELALISAVRADNLELAEMLLEAGADPLLAKERSAEDRTVLEIARDESSEEMVELLGKYAEPGLAELKKRLEGTVNEFVEAVKKKDDELLKEVEASRAEVMEVIRSGNAYQRAETVPALARIDDPRVVPALIDLLKDDDETVRGYAAQELDRLADKRAAGALVKALGDSSSRVRTVAANGLTKIGDRSAVGALVKTVIANLPKAGEDYHGLDSMRAALRAIAKLSANAPPEIIALLRPVATGETVDAGMWWLYEGVAGCLGEIGDKAAYGQLKRADEVLSTMHSDYKTWYAVRKAMAAIDPQAAPFNRPAAEILYSVRTGKFADEDKQQKWVQPLAQLAGPAVGDIEWSLCFQEPRRWEDRERKIMAVQALGEIGGPEAAKVLRDYIDSLFVQDVPGQQVLPGGSARRGARRRLCRHCDYPLRMALIALFKAQPDVDTAKEIVALLPLERFHQTHVLCEVEQATPRKIPSSSAVELCSLLLLPQPPEGIERFAAWRAAEFLARIGGEQAGQVLSRVLLESPNAKLVELAAGGLGKIKDYDAVATLVKASKMSHIPAEQIALAMGAINDKRALPALEDMAGRDDLSQADRLWIATALARLGKDYEHNAAIIRGALPDSLEQAKWLNDPETAKAVAALAEEDKNALEAAQTLEAIGTKEALEKALEILSSLIDPERPGDAERLQEVASSAARLAKKLGSPKESHYSDIATVAREVPHWFLIYQQQRPRAEGASGIEAAKRLPALARKLWIAEATRRLDLAAKQQEPNWEFELDDSALRVIEDIFAPELTPVLERVAKESRSTDTFPGKYRFVKFYNVRSLAAKILTEKTGQPHTFVDVDGRTHPGGWDPSQEK